MTSSATKSPETPRGLTAAEVADRTARGLVNRVRPSTFREYLDIVRRNLFTVFNALVAPAAIALFLIPADADHKSENMKDAIAISGFILANLFLGLVQEIRAKWHLDHLAILAETKARVLRDGEVREIAADDVVQDDCILVAAGETIVADGPMLDANYLEVDEALLTGESDPVARHPGESLLSGSFCVAGDGNYRAEHVGLESFAQRTSVEARAYRHTPSPLQKSIDRIVQICTWTAVAFVLVYVLLQIVRDGSFETFAAGFPQAELLRRTAATITSMVPQGLVLMTTLAFTLGAVRLARRGAVVQRLNAVEAMASIDVLCMDKTGTLTTNQLHVEQVRLVGDVSEDEVRDRLRLFAASSLDQSSKSIAALRDHLGDKEGEKAEVIDQLPFKSQNRYSAVRVRHGGQEHVLALGAGEALKPLLESDSHEKWESISKELTPTGLRLLLFAEAASGASGKFNGSLKGYTLRPLAVIALSDELRPEAAGVLKALAAQGIAFKIISGDNPETVRATVGPLAREAELAALTETPVVTGAELDSAADPAKLIDEHYVFGRVAPKQKVQIVSALKDKGHQVAMIGDGVNDVLPIKTANLGVAMGAGSKAAKTVSSIVLETNNFDLLPETLDEGRIIVRNVRRAAKLFLTKNVFALILIVGTLPNYGLAFPFLPRHVTLLNLLTIGLPALLIMLSREKVRNPSKVGFLREVGAFVLLRGALIGLVGLGVLMLSAWYFGDKAETGEGKMSQQTLLLATLVLNGFGTLWLVARDQEAASDARLQWLPLGLFPLFLLVMYLPPAYKFFAITPLSVWQWSIVLLWSFAGFTLSLLIEWTVHRLFHGARA